MNKFDAIKKKSRCSLCGGALVNVIDLGESPIANKFVDVSGEGFERYPLVLQHCRACFNLQLETCLSEEILYSDDYAYFTPTSASLEEHYKLIEHAFVERRLLPEKATLLEIGSNNGEFLAPYVAKGFTVLGVDPAKDATKIAEDKGVASICAFFDSSVAVSAREKIGEADMVVARHMFAHNSEPKKLISGVSEILSDDGVFYIENAYAIETLLNGEFDQVYHEHMFYYSALSLDYLLRTSGFELFDIIFSDIHGGTAGFFAARQGQRKVTPELINCFDQERQFYATDPDFFRFRAKAEKVCSELKAQVNQCIQNGEEVGVYSIPNKFFTLLSFADIDPSIFSAFVDTSPNKLNKYFPGASVKISSEAELADTSCSNFIVGAWNYKDDIKQRSAGIFKPGTRLIFPLPFLDVHVVK